MKIKLKPIIQKDRRKTENIEYPLFPDNFYHYGQQGYSINLTNEEVQTYVDEIYEKEKYMKTGDSVVVGTGNTIVIGIKYEDSFDIFVCKNYWDWSKIYE